MNLGYYEIRGGVEPSISEIGFGGNCEACSCLTSPLNSKGNQFREWDKIAGIKRMTVYSVDTWTRIYNTPFRRGIAKIGSKFCGKCTPGPIPLCGLRANWWVGRGLPVAYMSRNTTYRKVLMKSAEDFPAGTVDLVRVCSKHVLSVLRRYRPLSRDAWLATHVELPERSSQSELKYCEVMCYNLFGED